MTVPQKPLVTAGLTGGIASGKSTVAGFFRELGARVIDADAIAHQVLHREAVVGDLIRRFGAGILAPDGRVDRRRLGPRVFGDPEGREWLNRRIHPEVREEIAQRLEEERLAGAHSLAVVDVPLLVESGEPRRYGPLILAWCPPALQLHRIMARDGLAEPEARARLEAQLPIDGKRALADHIIDTSGAFEETRRQVESAYLALLR
jgi:dephospho-CoA kinase